MRIKNSTNVVLFERIKQSTNSIYQRFKEERPLFDFNQRAKQTLGMI